VIGDTDGRAGSRTADKHVTPPLAYQHEANLCQGGATGSPRDAW
jgi:hypothetical protein